MVPLDLELVDFLLGQAAQQALQDLSLASLDDKATLALLTKLRQSFTPAQAAALLDQARLRQAAAGKFPQAERMLLVDEALQQASSRAVACYRAGLFAGYHQVADLGCGIGADTIALAQSGLRVLAVERDPVRARIAAANLASLGLAGQVQVICADWTTLDLQVDAAFVDPSRRSGDRRIFHLDQMEPPLSAIMSLRRQVSRVAVKAAPGIAHREIPADAQVEFISERGNMKEALLRFGNLRNGDVCLATLLPGPHHLDGNAPCAPCPVSEPLAYLYEPDPAILRAGLVQHLATRMGAAQIDPTIAYLSSQHRAETPFARAWQVLRHGPFHLKTLNRWLREEEAGQVVIKKRGSPIDPDTFARRLKTVAGGPQVTVFLTRALGSPWMIVGTSI